MNIKFSKYHGTGNDFIIVDNRITPRNWTQEEIASWCHRRYGIGADGFMLVEMSHLAHIKMVYYNADGSTAVMCGNGIRCFSKYVFDHGIVPLREFDVETAAGIKHIVILEDGGDQAHQIRVDMGAAMFQREQIGINALADPVMDQTLQTDVGPVVFSAVSMGNPHAIIEVEEVDGFPVSQWGPLVETNEMFPEGINVNFTQWVDRKNCKVITWERGSGLTLACGTGSCAAAALLHKKGMVDDQVTVHIPGGRLIIELGETVFMTGPAVWVFDGWKVLTEEEPA
jgi:diaminopimelate epimerase